MNHLLCEYFQQGPSNIALHFSAVLQEESQYLGVGKPVGLDDNDILKTKKKNYLKFYKAK